MPSEAVALADFVASLAETRAALLCPECHQPFDRPIKYLDCLHTVCAAHARSKFCAVCRADVRHSAAVPDDAVREAAQALAELEALYRDTAEDVIEATHVATIGPEEEIVEACANEKLLREPASNAENKHRKNSSECYNKVFKKVDTKTAGVQASKPVAQSKSRSTPKNSPLEKKNLKGETALHVACRCLKIDKITELLEKGANPNTKDNAGWTPLHEVTQRGSVEAARLLLERGALPAVPGLHNETPLHEAVRYGHADVAAELVRRGADVKAKNIKGETPLSLADAEMLELLSLRAEPTGQLESALETSMRQSAEDFEGMRVYLDVPYRTVKQRMKMLARHHDIQVEDAYTDKTTHLIVAAEDDCAACSVPVLRAVVAGAWVLRSEWVAAATDAYLPGFDTYEVAGIFCPEYNGPQRSRLNKYKRLPGLLNGCHFYFHNLTTDYEISKTLVLSKSTLTKLVVDAGGKVLRREPNPEAIPASEVTVPYHAAEGSKLAQCSHYIIFTDMFEPMYNMAHVKALPLGWLLECMQKYELCDPW